MALPVETYKATDRCAACDGRPMFVTFRDGKKREIACPECGKTATEVAAIRARQEVEEKGGALRNPFYIEPGRPSMLDLWRQKFPSA